MSVGRSSILNSSKDIKKIKKDLVKRKEELEEQLAQIHEDQSTPQDITGQDVGDQTISSIIENLRNTLQDTELGEYKRVVTALEKIEEGTYGTCIDCSKDIGQKRLKSYPNADRCVVCQEAFEESGGYH
ncbi:TraR/DksA family transcriptional regulator [Candidatus Dependentiae bacterium]